MRLVEANGFYRAYNHSAYLFHQVIAQHKVTRKFVKNINQVLSHYDCYQIRKVLVFQGRLRDFGEVSEDCLRFYPDMLTFKINQAKKFGGLI